MGFLQRASAVAQVCDGAWGFWIQGEQADFIVGGWESGPINKKVWKSVNEGVTFTAQTDCPWPFHATATTVVNDIAYIVGSDTIHITQEGSYQNGSAKYQSGSWSTIAANCGIANRSLCALAYLGSSFYLFGGCDSITDPNPTYFDTVMRSDDGCATFTTILADTKPQWKSNLAWGGFVSHRGKLWRIGTGINAGNSHYDTLILSSTDGITWTYRGNFRGLGRWYHQLVSHNGSLWVFNGKNFRYSGNAAYGGDMIDYWKIDELNGGKILQTYMGSTGWSNRHAPAIWSRPRGFMCFGGSGSSGSALWSLEI